ncbi:UDP-N-acetylmuramoyl-L-alanine--D-glutamate ligase [Rhizosphaericola mali]|uniref:UDP-N-acetylmuramoylalanine--D-glutamate ligase n=1 Tax=Rhizosphaericola mali TaxID=2545455 RepID=A0A5P2GCD0_9BACT|nr:UDP-N-acetylmuramoyl-L-alanine--D-glutamate ligase [Rhizosphaericola mali]QES90873.1 UDP-N-acetylmuramoyl-L-alanine--D-glutamate ligase [Rhizosphaericola mali]
MQKDANVSNKKIVILGAGESGVGAAILAKEVGYKAIFVSDSGKISDKYRKKLDAHQIEFESGGHTESKILDADEMMKSPGIPEENFLVVKIRANNIPVISEIEFAYRYKGDSKIVGITGSNGKTTTTSLIYRMFELAGLDVALVGNIGFSIAEQVALTPKEYYVAEISSFQLDDIVTFRPDVALLLNITPDHLDRYDHKFENYVEAKFKIAENQIATDYFVYNEDDPVITERLKTFPLKSIPLPFSMNKEIKKGAFIKDDQMTLNSTSENVSMSIYEFALKGKHNQYNTMAAGIASQVMGIRKEKIRDAIKTFNSLEHRMEPVATVRGVEFINDSKATNLNSVWFALESMQQPTILILGGIDKGNDYSLLLDDVKAKVKAIVCLGLDNSKIHAAFDGQVPNEIIDTDNMIDCVNKAFALAESGDAVLLSPACSSFDLFKSYEDRGTQFKDAVKLL